MKKILGLDLGTTSIGWALVNEAEKVDEASSIIQTGVRVVPLSTDEELNFGKGGEITTNQDRTLKRGARRNLQRYKQRRKKLKEALLNAGFIQYDTKIAEDGKNSTHETLRIRASAAREQVSKRDFARVLFNLNKKRGYKSNRKGNEEGGQVIDDFDLAVQLEERGITPGEYLWEMKSAGKKGSPQFFPSDLQKELRLIWEKQSSFYPELNEALWERIQNINKTQTTKIIENQLGLDGKGKYSYDETIELRSKGLKEKLPLMDLAEILGRINAAKQKTSGYLGEISDRSKILKTNQWSIGELLYHQISENKHYRTKGKAFFRKDYEREFDQIWETQSKFYPELTLALKSKIKEYIIFYQRPLKSQKGNISTCELEGQKKEVLKNGKKVNMLIGPKVTPKSSPFFQAFRTGQAINILEVSPVGAGDAIELSEEVKKELFSLAQTREKIGKREILKLLGLSEKEYTTNIEEIPGNTTYCALFEMYNSILEETGHEALNLKKSNLEEAIKYYEEVFNALDISRKLVELPQLESHKTASKSGLFQLWHLLYSFEGDDSTTGDQKLVEKIAEKYRLNYQYARMIANIVFEDEYGSLSTKAISKLLPEMENGHPYHVAAELAGYRHSKWLNKEERRKRDLKAQLEILPKNSLRNPVVEKILNQMIHVVNGLKKKYGEIDEVRVELARELKSSAKERKKMIQSISNNTKEIEQVRKILKEKYGVKYVNKTLITKYRLWEESNRLSIYTGKGIHFQDVLAGNYDIEHIIPKSKLFDDSFSNKTLCERSLNEKKGNMTAYDFLKQEFSTSDFEAFQARVEDLAKLRKISNSKKKKLLMKEDELPDGFIERDLRTTQYISKKALEILHEAIREVTPTTGKITNLLREDWQLVDVLKELNWEKYKKLGLTEEFTNPAGHTVRRIKDWSKRNDHRHHAMDALTVAFTKRGYVQMLNTLNAKGNLNHKKHTDILSWEEKYLERDGRGRKRFKAPMPLKEFRQSAKEHLEQTLVSFKAKNKVYTINKNTVKVKNGTNVQKVKTPRAQLHKETIYGTRKKYETKEVPLGSKMDLTTALDIANKQEREAVIKRLAENNNDPKKAFGGRNSVAKNPLTLANGKQMGKKVKLAQQVTEYTIRKPLDENVKLEKVVDPNVKRILEERLNDFGGSPKKAFANLRENPVWFNKEQGIPIKNVTIKGVSNAEVLHQAYDHLGQPLEVKGKEVPKDYVSLGNNHHVAIYKDATGKLQEKLVSYMEAMERVNQDLPIVDKTYNEDKGWEFQFTLKSNEMFVFPNEAMDFYPSQIDLRDPNNSAKISANLFRVQKISSLLSGIWFRHHLETEIKNDKVLKNEIFKVVQSTSNLNGIIKLRINHIGEVVQIGEY